MTTLVGTLSGNLIVQTSVFTRGMQAAGRSVDQLDSKAKNADRSLKRLGDDLNRAGDSFVRFGTRASMALTAPITALGGFALKTAAWFQQTDVAMQTFMGSAQQAHKYVQDLTQFSATTPFQVKDWLQGSRLLLAYGFQAKQLIPTLKTLGDTTASFGIEPARLDNIIRALGEMKAFGRVYGRQLLMLAMNGIPIYNILQEKLGLTSQQIHEIGLQGLDSAKVIPLILQGLKQTFGGQMQRQMQTFNGLWSNLMDNVTITANRFGQDWLPTASRVVKELVSITKYLRNLDGEQRMQILKWAAVAAAIPPVIIGLGLLIKMAGTTATVLSFLGGAIELAFSPVTLIILGMIGAVGLFATAWDKNWGHIQETAKKAWGAIQPVLDHVRNGLNLKDVAVGVSAVWAVSFARPFLAALIEKSGIRAAAGSGAARYLFRLGGMIVAAELLWKFVLPQSVKQSVTDVWHRVAAAFNAVDLGPLNPFKRQVATWLEGLKTDSWQIPALTVGVGFAAFKVLTAGARVAGMLGGSLGSALAGAVVPLALGAIAITAFGALTLSPADWQKFVSDVQGIVNDHQLSLKVKIAKLTFTIDTDVLLKGLQNMYASFAEAAKNNLPKSVGAPISSLFGDISSQIGKQLEGMRVVGAILGSRGNAPQPQSLSALLDSVRKAEGNSNYGVVAGRGVAGTNFYPSKLPSRLQASFQDATAKLQPKSEAWYRQVASYAILAYWETFTTKFPQYAGKAFSEVGPQVQAQFIRYFGKSWAPIGASNDPNGLNKNWIPNVLRFMGLTGYAKGGMLPGRGGPDQFLAMLAPGEAVVPSGVVNRGSPAVINWFRAMGVPGFADGGLPGGAAGLSLGSTNVGQMNDFLAGLQTTVRQIGTVLLKGFATIMNVLVTVIEAIGKAILGDQRWEKISGTIKDARKQLQDFIDMLQGKGPRSIPVPQAAATIGSNGPSFWQKLGAAMGPALNTGVAALGQAQPLAKNTIDAFAGGAAEGGPMAGLANAGMTLLTSSQTFQQIMGALTPLMQALADAVGSLLKPIIPLVNVVTTVLAPVLKMFGVLISTLLLPIMPVLFMALKLLGLAVLGLAIGIGYVWNAIASVINFLLGWLGVNLPTVDTGKLTKNFNDLANMTYKDSQSLKDHKKAVDAVTASLKNVPAGFKTALMTFQSARGYAVPHMASGGIVTRPTMALIGEAGPEAVVPLGRPGAGGTVYLNATIVSNDPHDIWKKLKGVIAQENFVRSGTTIASAPRFSGGNG